MVPRFLSVPTVPGGGCENTARARRYAITAATAGITNPSTARTTIRAVTLFPLPPQVRQHIGGSHQHPRRDRIDPGPVPAHADRRELVPGVEPPRQPPRVEL